jgi:hypothetical protein
MDAPYRGDMKVAPSMGARIETPATPSPPPSTAERDPADSVIVPLDVISIHAPQAGRDAGFSRKFWYVTHMLTHSKYHIAATDLADGTDGSYFQYVMFPNFATSYEQTFGGPPYGNTMSS